MSRRERQLRRRRSKGGPLRPLLLALGVIVIACGIGAAAAVGWVISVAHSGPSLADIQPKDQGAASTVYAADGKTRLGFITTDVLRNPLPGTQIPDLMRDATVAIEDKRFFDHKGVDFEGIVRAAIKNLESKDDVQGGSTLTMQLIRNLYTGNTTRKGLKGYKRKIREAYLAQQLEDLYPGRTGKVRILNSYLNNVPYGTVGGQTAVGVASAARIFFDKTPRQLTLPQAALLAGLPQAPTSYNPFLSPQRALERRNDVLRAMVQQGYVSEASAARAIASPLGLSTKAKRYYTTTRESYFFDYVKQQLIDEYGIKKVEAGGMHVYTTLSLKMQKAARASLDRALGGTDRSGAIVTIDPANGGIKAMASNAAYGQFKFNLASQGGYAAGSTFKVMVLMAALRMGVDPTTTTYVSKPLKFDDPKWGPIDVQTYGHDYPGSMNLVRATLRSDNTVYEQLDLDVGPEKVTRAARDMGIKSPLESLPAEGLGGIKHGVSPLEMANAYATIASGGWRNRVTAITRVCVPKGTTTAVYTCKREKVHRTRAFSDGITAEATRILEQNMQAGTGTKAQIGCPAAGKTGTVDDFTDAWFVGFTPRLATSVWVGHATERRTLGPGSAGGEVAAPIWGDYMKVAHGDFCGDFRAPKNPFVATPFFGKYAREGVKASQTATDPLSTTTTAPGASGTSTTGGGTTSPSAPSDPPSTPTTGTPAAQDPPATAAPDPGSNGAAGAPPP
jgi:penicillin-binding protein 1A